MKTLSTFIYEKFISTLYHFTSHQFGKYIIAENRFKCSFREDEINYKFLTGKEKENLSAKELENNKYFFASLTRYSDIEKGFTVDFLKNTAVSSRCECTYRFELDGDLLSNNYKIKPFNYVAFEPEEAKIKSGNARSLLKKTKKAIMWEEREERLYSKKEYIENFNKYVKHLDILIIAKRDFNFYIDKIKENISNSVASADWESKIFIYTNKEDFNKKVNGINISEI